MARKADSFYFDNFNACAENNCRAARLLEQVMREYDPDGLQARIDEMHELEQAGDELRHELLDCVLTAFITPIEREGIVALSARLDDVTDCIEGVLHRLYYNNVRELTAGALEMVTLLVRACDEVRDTVAELPNFRKSKTMHDHIVAVNTASCTRARRTPFASSPRARPISTSSIASTPASTWATRSWAS